MAVQYINGVPCIDGGGELRKLAALPPPPHMLATAPRFTNNVAAPDPSTWQDFDFADILPPIIRNQSSHGSCTGHAGVTAEDIVLRKIGSPPPLLSCTFPYAQVNNGQDQGASVSSILQVLKQLGTCTQAECGTDQIYKQQIPQSAYETAKKYQVFEAFLCRTFDELCEAINRGFPVAFGIQVGNNFSRLSLDGVAPLPDMVVGGHALCGVGIKKYKGGWIIKTQNSWGDRWGMHGFCYLTRGHFTNLIDAYALQYAENNNPPPIALAEQRILIPSFSLDPAPLLPELEPVKEETPAPEPEKPAPVELPAQQEQPLVKEWRDSLMQQLMAEEDAKFLAAVNAPLPEAKVEEKPAEEEEKPVEGGPGLVHTDPDAIVNDTRRNRKNRHRH